MTQMDAQIEQLGAIVDRCLGSCQETWRGIQCNLLANHEPAQAHRFPLADPGDLSGIIADAFSLAYPCRDIFLLCDIHGFTVFRAAAILGIGPTEAKTRLNHARRQLYSQPDREP